MDLELSASEEPDHPPRNSTISLGFSSSPKLTPQYLAALACAGGGFAYGSALGWASPASCYWNRGSLLPIPHLNNYTTSESRLHRNESIDSMFLPDNNFDMSILQYSWVVTSFPLGAAAAVIPSGFMVRCLGPRISAFISLVPLVIGWLLVMLSRSFETLLIGRLFIGIGCGPSAIIVPVYTSEIAIPPHRGRIMGLFQTMVTMGILFMFAIGPFVNLPTLMLISSIVTLVFYGFYYFMPESPTFLMGKGLYAEALLSMRKLRGLEYDIQPEIEILRKNLNRLEGESQSTLQALKRPNTLRALLITCGLMIFFQMSGINALVNMVTIIFETSRSPMDSHVATIITGVVQVVGAVFSILLVDRLGRRVLLLAAAVTCAFTSLIVGVFFEIMMQDPAIAAGITWLPLAAVCGFFLVFSMGYGTIAWIILGELFDVDIKSVAASIPVTINFILSFVVTKYSIVVFENIGIGASIWLFSGFSVAGIVFIIILVPETKSKTVEEIQIMLNLYKFA